MFFIKINFLNSRFSPFLIVSGVFGGGRKLGEACRHIFSEYGPDWSRGVREIAKNGFIHFLRVVNLDFSPLELGIGHFGPRIRTLRKKLA